MAEYINVSAIYWSLLLFFTRLRSTALEHNQCAVILHREEPPFHVDTRESAGGNKPPLPRNRTLIGSSSYMIQIINEHYLLTKKNKQKSVWSGKRLATNKMFFSISNEILSGFLYYY
jgi:hypothetical protein